MRRILLGCMVVVFGLVLGVRVASAQGPPLTYLNKIDEADFDIAGRTLVKNDRVYYLRSKSVFQRDIYEVKTFPVPPRIKYMVEEEKLVTQPGRVPVWVEVTKAPQENLPDWKYVTHQ